MSHPPIVLPDPDWVELRRIASADPTHASPAPDAGFGSAALYVSCYRGHHIYAATGSGPFIFGAHTVKAPNDLAIHLSSHLHYCDGRWFNTAWSATCHIDEKLAP
uniref:Uncharacterized protein n=1 Tax=Pseudomonas phage Cygsa01 TaxID=3138529 RepID=A0AAU6W3I6_9VIRU